MEKTKFSGYRVLIASMVYCFVSTGFLGIYPAAFSLFPDYYNTSITAVSSCTSICAVLSFVGGILAVGLIKKITARNCLFIGAVCCLMIAFVMPAIRSVAALIILFALLGCMSGFSMISVVSTIVGRWFVARRNVMLSILIGFNLFGGAFFQFVAGFLFDAFGVGQTYMIMGITCGIILLCMVFLIKDKPEDIGQVALGAEKQTAESGTIESGAIGSDRDLFKNPIFWLYSAAVFMCVGSFNVVFVYCTTIFTGGGMELSQATMVLSAFSLTGAVYAFCSGKVLDTIGLKKYILLSFVAGGICNGMVIVYNHQPSMFLVVIIVITYALANCSVNIYSMVSPILFDQEYIASVNTKSVAIASLGCAVVVPISSAIMEKISVDMAYIVLIGTSILTIILYFAAIEIAKKQGKRV